MQKKTEEPSKTAKANPSTRSTRSGPLDPKGLSMADLLASTGYHIPTLRSGQEVRGKIISLTHSEMLLDIGAKSEGIIFGRELASVMDYVKQLSVGDEIEATVVYPENDAGQVVLSLRKHSAEKRWLELEEARNENADIDVVALEANRGGLICEWSGIRGFLPASQIASGGNLEEMIGKTTKARVIEADKATNRLILSQKVPDKADLEKIKKLLSKVNIGDKFEGIVSAVLPFGLFVEIKTKGSNGAKGSKGTEGGGADADGSKVKLEGLVHISEISWEKIDDVAKYFNVGDNVSVMVIDKDEQGGKLSLSIKQLADDPFTTVSAKYSKDQEVAGTVSKVTPYGVFINLEGGIEGLVHVSKIPPNESWEVGDKVECIIEAIDAAARRISLVPVVREKPILYR